jgi:hypothetical protein
MAPSMGRQTAHCGSVPVPIAVLAGRLHEPPYLGFGEVLPVPKFGPWGRRSNRRADLVKSIKSNVSVDWMHRELSKPRRAAAGW